MEEEVEVMLVEETQATAEEGEDRGGLYDDE